MVTLPFAIGVARPLLSEVLLMVAIFASEVFQVTLLVMFLVDPFE